MTLRRHLIIPDAQIRPGANTEHVDWAALVAAHEREACAKICEAIGNDAEIDELICSALQQADETIRARGKEMPR